MQQEKGPKMPWAILGSAWLLAFAISVPMFCVPPIEHILREELLLTHAQTSLLFSAPLLMMVAIAIPGGLIADRIGVRKAAGIGIIIIVVGSILRGTAAPIIIPVMNIPVAIPAFSLGTQAPTSLGRLGNDNPKPKP